jgi:hypothetical protein
MNHRKKSCSLLRLPRKIRSRNLLRSELCLNLVDCYSIISRTAGSSRRNTNIWTRSDCRCYCQLILNLVNGLVNVHGCVNSHLLVNGQLDQKGKGRFKFTCTIRDPTQHLTLRHEDCGPGMVLTPSSEATWLCTSRPRGGRRRSCLAALRCHRGLDSQRNISQIPGQTTL